MQLLLPADRVPRWCANFESRHGGATYAVADAALRLDGADGSVAELRLPFDDRYDGPATPVDFVAAVDAPRSWGLLLVRKGGFAVARLQRGDLVAHKIGQRHVQGRTKAGGQSQQRFARRRDNQARLAYEAAREHAMRIFDGGIDVLVTGGDRSAVDQCLDDRRLQWWLGRVDSRWLPTPDPRRTVLDQAVADAQAVSVDVTNA